MNWVGQVKRRIRTRSVMLSSYRKHQEGWNRWLQWEICKPMIPLVLITLLHMLELVTISHPLMLAMLAACVIWMGFVSWHALGASLRMDHRRRKLLERAGADCTLPKTFANRQAWRAVADKRTMREILDSPDLVSSDRMKE